jgi:hypothetical protein
MLRKEEDREVICVEERWIGIQLREQNVTLGELNMKDGRGI